MVERKRREGNTRLTTYDIKIKHAVKKWTKQFGKHDTEEMKVLVANLIASLKHRCTLVYSRNTGERHTAKRRISVRRIIKAVDLLEELGYATTEIGVASEKVENRRPSLLHPTQKFIELWGEPTIEVCNTDYLSAIEKVEVRDDKKQPVKVRRTQKMTEISDLVEELNAVNERHTILDKHGQRMSNLYCRIFNLDLDHGGRYYRAEILNMDNSDSSRLDLTMDGEPVVEVDYSGLHIRMAAALAGEDAMLDIADDPYAFAGEVNRPLVKVATNIMLNCRSKRSAVAAIGKELPKYNTTYTQPSKVFNDIDAQFENLGDVFCREDSFGLYLQSLDSKLASEVIKPFIEMDVPILPVHDSFVTKKRLTEVLCWTMGKVFRDEFGVDFWVPVTVEYKNENGEVVSRKSKV